TGHLPHLLEQARQGFAETVGATEGEDPYRHPDGCCCSRHGWPAQRSSQATRTSGLPVVPPTYACSATPPASWRSAVESFAVARHAAGSGSPSRHTLARTVVGDVPVTCARTRSFSPGTSVSPS